MDKLIAWSRLDSELTQGIDRSVHFLQRVFDAGARAKDAQHLFAGFLDFGRGFEFLLGDFPLGFVIGRHRAPGHGLESQW